MTPTSRQHRNTAGRAALAISIIALVMSMSGLGSAATHAARHAVSGLIDGHALTKKAKAGGIPILGKDGKLPASMIPAALNAVSQIDGHTLTKKARTGGIPILGKNGELPAGMLPSILTADKLSSKIEAQLTGSCPTGTVDIGSWCLMDEPYQLTAAESQAGVNDFAWASQACDALGGFLPDSSQLIGAAGQVKLESVFTDNQNTATVDYNDDGGVVSTAVDEREMSSSLITTAAGSDAAGSEGVSAGSTPGTPGEPDPTPQPAVPFPPTLQYVTVYSNGTQGGFAGAEPVSSPENFRCGFYLKQGAAN